MPQFDITILNTQICNIINFSLSYLFYLKSILLLLFVFIKLHKKLFMNLLVYSIEESIVLFNYMSLLFFNIILFIYIIKLGTYITKVGSSFTLYF